MFHSFAVQLHSNYRHCVEVKKLENEIEEFEEIGNRGRNLKNQRGLMELNRREEKMNLILIH